MMRKNLAPLAGITLLAVLGGSSCSTNTQGDDASPVFLTVSFDLLPLQKNVGDGAALQIQTITIRSILKVPPVGGGGTQFLDTRVDDYVVEWSRIDGGTAAPASQVWGGNILVPAGGTSTLSNYPVMSAGRLLDPPLNQLFPFNGGIDRETGRVEIRCKAKVTFRGHTMAGQPVSGFGTMDMIFIYRPPTPGPQAGLAAETAG